MVEFHWNCLWSLHSKQVRVFLAHTQNLLQGGGRGRRKGEKVVGGGSPCPALCHNFLIITVSQQGDYLFLQSIPG